MFIHGGVNVSWGVNLRGPLHHLTKPNHPQQWKRSHIKDLVIYNVPYAFRTRRVSIITYPNFSCSLTGSAKLSTCRIYMRIRALYECVGRLARLLTVGYKKCLKLLHSFHFGRVCMHTNGVNLSFPFRSSTFQSLIPPWQRRRCCQVSNN